MQKWRRLLEAVGFAIASLVLSAHAHAAEVRIGVRTQTSSMDPHVSDSATGRAAVLNVFDPLIERDKDMRLRPGLALSWRKAGAGVWELKLRPGVRWHDGAPFTADDVLFTFQRVGKLPNSPAPSATVLSGIAGAEKVDDLTLRIATKTDWARILPALADIPVISRHVGRDATTADYDSGKATIGTGPFRFVSWQPGGKLVLARNDDYWGRKAEFAAVDVLPMPDDAGRVAALLSGEVVLIDAVPPDSARRLATDSKVALFEIDDVPAAYLRMDTSRAVTPFITAGDGATIANPLRDPKVRRALSLAIDRKAISRLRPGEPGGQPSGPATVGVDPDVRPAAYDPAAARALLAEAGYPDGFKMTLHGPGDRDVAGSRIAQAVARMFERIDIAMSVGTIPSNAVFAKAGDPEFSIVLIASGAPQDAGDRDDAARRAHEAPAAASGEDAIIPLRRQVNVWATRKGFVYEARRDGLTLAHSLGRPR